MKPKRWTLPPKSLKTLPYYPRDARESSDVFFKQGQGDVLINYENEVILAAEWRETALCDTRR